MIISICGDKKGKEFVIEKLKTAYGNNIVVCDYFHISFKTIVKYEKKKYDLLKKYEINTALDLYREYVDKIINERINKFINENKEKIIILVSNGILSVDIDDTTFFNQSDLKILLKFENKRDSILEKTYDITKFDYVIKDIKNINIKKLLKL